MNPGARIAAVIELLDLAADGAGPADRVLSRYLAARRYIGAKDRRALADRLFAVLRGQARLGWWCDRAGLDPTTGRHRMLAHLVLVEGLAVTEVAALFDGGRYRPAALSDEEVAAVKALEGQALDHPAQPDWVRLECPGWLLPQFRDAFGEDVEAELRALMAEAPLDLRVNTLKADREAARRRLAEGGIAAAPCPLSPLGLRVEGRRPVTASGAFREGLVEVQDEGSQLVAWLTDARPDMAVADLCAGGGGKTLALACAMNGKGRLVALDIDAVRLKKAKPRLRRAGALGVETIALEPGGAPWLADNRGHFDRVLLDAPCSGSGTWRRNPDARWRLDQAGLAALAESQKGLLDQGADLVAPEGRLVYATCSLLPDENERPVEAFLERRGDFRVLPPAEVWQDRVSGPVPIAGPFVRLTPASHGTDGFFVAILERQCPS